VPRAILAVVAALAVVAGCGGDEQPSQATLEVGYSYGMDVGDVGDNLAFDRLEKQEGITVSTRDMGGAPQAVAGLTRGDIDLAQMQYTQLLDAVAAGAPIKAVLGQNMEPEHILVGGDGIDGVEDLRGRTVAVSGPDSLGYFILRRALTRVGLSLDDVKVVFIDESTTRAPALAARRVDAASLDFADLERLRARDGDRFTLLTRGSDVLPETPALVFAVDEDWAAENSDLLAVTVRTLLDGYEDVYEDESRGRWISEARRLFLTGEDRDVAPRLYDFYRSIGLWPKRSTLPTEHMHDVAVRDMVATNQIEGSVSYDDAWLADYWRDAAEG
jgi:ABC-type nitrate/sulfonate/bicarbonate transport system substrate-binding protein